MYSTFFNSCNHGLHRRGHAGIHATHEIHTMLYFGAHPCPWTRKIDMCGVLGNWVCGQELGRGQPGHASPVTIWPTCVTTATRLLRIFGIFETLGYSGYYSQVTMLVLSWFWVKFWRRLQRARYLWSIALRWDTVAFKVWVKHSELTFSCQVRSAMANSQMLEHQICFHFQAFKISRTSYLHKIKWTPYQTYFLDNLTLVSVLSTYFMLPLA